MLCKVAYKMRPIVTDVPWSVCLSVTTMSPTKTAEPIEMPFGLWTRVGPKNCMCYRRRPEFPEGNYYWDISLFTVNYRVVFYGFSVLFVFFSFFVFYTALFSPQNVIAKK